jgi:gamma-glutamylcyclotransferase (GGCT)/AIG2-like uncharacterized protein YtfP
MLIMQSMAGALLEWLRINKDAVQALATVLASLSFLYGIMKYRGTVQLKRAEWLHKLFLSFYEQTRYRQIRELLDGRQRNPGETALQAVTRLHKESELDDYLNFFEFLAGLQTLGQMRKKDVLILFEYWIQRLRCDPDIAEYIRRFGYENLSKLLPKSPLAIAHIFVYGTLMSPAEVTSDNSNPRDQVKSYWRKIGTGFVNGRKYDLGRYPGVVLKPLGNDRVFGELYEIRDREKLLLALDNYEGAEYQRVPVDVYMNDMPVVVAWCYTISQEQAEKLRFIPSSLDLPPDSDSPPVGRIS